VRTPWHRLVAEQLASWWPCVLLTPPVVAGTLRARRAASRARMLAMHGFGVVLFLTVGGALMGLAESLLPWAEPDGGLLGAAGWGILRYIGPDLLLYALIAVGTEAAAHAWESRQQAVAAATYARQLAEARLHVLSAQLQPHFLFNTLHAISALVWADPARADRLLARLSEMLRLTLRSGTRVETTLAEELTLLERYAEIQEARYGDRLRVSFDVEAGVREALVPRLILQPLVENAIRHGVTRRITPGQVEVRAWQGDGRLNLTVRDDGVGLGAGVREGVGLSITRARLCQLYGREQRFALAPAPDGGAMCSLSIPFRMQEAAG
jgi:signal transduction histidine kinase